MKMKKRAVLLAISVCVCLSQQSFAQSYVSEEGGFSLNIPAKYTVVGTKNMVAVSDSTSGVHSMQAERQLHKGQLLTTKSFRNELDKMKLAIAAGKDLVREPEYEYLWGKNDDLTRQFIGKGAIGPVGTYTYRLGKLGGEPALIIDNTAKLNYKMTMPTAYTEQQQKQIKEVYPAIVFSADGKEASLTMKTVTTSYIMSKNDIMYTASNGYVDQKDLVVQTDTKSKTGQDSILAGLQQEPFDMASYKKISKTFLKDIKFFLPELNNNPLKIHSKLMNKDYSIPHDWLYCYSQNKFEGNDINFFGAIPYSSVESFAKEGLLKNDNGITMDTVQGDWNITSNLSKFNIKNFLQLYQEGLVSVSGKMKPDASGGLFDEVLKNPQVSELTFRQMMSKVILPPQIKQYINPSNLQYDIKLNPTNGLVTVAGDLALHFPQNLSQALENTKENVSQELIPFDAAFQSKVYFDKDNLFNALVYFKKQGIGDNQEVQTTFDNFTGFRRVGPRQAAIKS